MRNPTVWRMRSCFLAVYAVPFLGVRTLAGEAAARGGTTGRSPRRVRRG
jgi:hypothetical protein